jgi:hypothetical protein
MTLQVFFKAEQQTEKVSISKEISFLATQRVLSGFFLSHARRFSVE